MVMVGGGWRFVWVALLVSLVVAVVAVSILTTMHVINKSSTPVGVGFNAPAPVGLPVNVSLNMPIYVVGPQSLTQRLVGVGVPQSLIKPVNLSQLSALPGNSTILIGYSVIKPSVVVGVVNGVVRLNLTSPVIALLISLVAKGDLIMLYGNSSDLMAMEYLLAYTWARKYGTLYLNYLNGHGVPSDYLVAYPIIPISGKEALAVAFGGPNYLIIGPVTPSELIRAVITYTVLRHLPVSLGQVNGAEFSLSMIKANLQSTSSPYPDACGYIYQEYYQNATSVSSGIYESGNYYFIWLLPMMGSSSYPWYGFAGYSDGNGTFYYDTCLVISNQVGSPPGPYPYVPLYVYGYVGYDPTSTMTNNGGEVLTETGTFDYYTSYKYYNESFLSANSLIASPACTGGDCLQPQPTSSTTNYSISVFVGVEIGEDFEVTLPSGSSEGIGLYYGPSTQAFYANDGNVTWTFNLNNANTPNDTYYNDFEDISPAAWIMPNFSSSQQNAYLPIDMSTKVMTSSQLTYIGLCEYYNNTYEYVWVDGGWWLTAQPTGSSTGLVPSSTSWTYSISPSASQYITGVSSWSTLEPIGCSGR
ncbi:MAG: hypothetical protein RXN84_06405 [Caldivirga sp.]